MVTAAIAVVASMVGVSLVAEAAVMLERFFR
jgi:hypothetical protein